MRHRIRTVGSSTAFEQRYGHSQDVVEQYDSRIGYCADGRSYDRTLQYAGGTPCFQEQPAQVLPELVAITNDTARISAPSVLDDTPVIVEDNFPEDEVVPLVDEILNAKAVGTPLKRSPKEFSNMFAGGSFTFDESAGYDDNLDQVTEEQPEEGGIPWGAIGLGLLFLL